MRIALGVEYCGHDFFGWQSQPGMKTVQGTVEEALSKIANEPIHLFCAGRTDAGVHATGQVIHFDTKAKRHLDAWVYGTNAQLPPAICIRWSRHVDYSFHARFKAIARRYRYVIFNHPVRPAILSARASWHYYPLDIERMRTAASFLIGEQDFSSFRSSKCNSHSPVRNITDFSIKRHGDFVIFEIEANAFLHHMVRNIAGVLMKIGGGFQEAGWMQEVLLAKSRKAAAITAPAAGLYLSRVCYPEPYIFPLSDHLFLI
jgi:tRNA pseudouridine38-40 synthase